VVVQHGWQRLGVCSAEGCDDVYVDTSRNASRRYCSNTCASRSTVAAYRARRKA
jgi:predicted RNA-binding Zn ribbon-like protein